MILCDGAGLQRFAQDVVHMVDVMRRALLIELRFGARAKDHHAALPALRPKTRAPYSSTCVYSSGNAGGYVMLVYVEPD